jgi:hypothetical protein
MLRKCEKRDPNGVLVTCSDIDPKMLIAGCGRDLRVGMPLPRSAALAACGCTLIAGAPPNARLAQLGSSHIVPQGVSESRPPLSCLLQMRQDFAFDEQELHTLLTHFKVMRSATGMNACKARLQIL